LWGKEKEGDRSACRGRQDHALSPFFPLFSSGKTVKAEER